MTEQPPEPRRPPTEPPPLLEVRGLRTDIRLKRSTVHAVDGVDLTVRAGETLGLVGESGCGKTMTALSLIRQLPAGGEVVDGTVRLDGVDLLALDDTEMRQIRGNLIGMVFQDPLTSLNPLDVTIQAQILQLIDQLRRDLGMAVVLVTHDLGVIAGRADRVAVMYAGRVVEQAGTEELFLTPRHRYTEALFSALPERAAETRERLYTIPGLPPDLTTTQTGCRFAPRCRFAQADCALVDPPLVEVLPGRQHACLHPVDATHHLEARERFEVPAALHKDRQVLLSVQHLVKDFPLRHHLFGRSAGTVSAVADVSFEVRRGLTLGLVGESGCGKTTTGRLVVGLDPTRRREQARPTVPLRGELPSAVDPPSGCRFRTRCPRAQQVCGEQEPPLADLAPGDHRVACHFPLNIQVRTDQDLPGP